jgi:hypothetical protein
MTSLGPDGLRIIAQYVKKTGTAPENAGESLRVEGQGLIPRPGPNYCMQIAIKDDPGNYRFPVPAEFNKKGFFMMQAIDLPVAIPYGGEATVSVIEITRRGEKTIAQSPVRFRTV